MQQLLVLAESNLEPVVPAGRGVVAQRDALDAVVQLAAVLDQATQAVRLLLERGSYAATMLMVIREYIQPLPPVPGDDGVPDKVTRDLERVLRGLRRNAGQSGIQGYGQPTALAGRVTAFPALCGRGPPR